MKRTIFSIILSLIGFPAFPVEPDSMYIEEFRKLFEESYLRCSKKADEASHPDDAVLKNIKNVPIEDIGVFLLYRSSILMRKCMDDVYEEKLYFLTSIYLSETANPEDKKQVASILLNMSNYLDFLTYKKYRAMKTENLKVLEAQDYFNHLFDPYKVWNHIKSKRNLGDDLGSP